jgi:predicted AAA+ superfamily ATPase
LFLELKKRIGNREILSIKGPGQSGKTTILKMLSKYLIEELKVDKRNEGILAFDLDDFGK